MIEIHAQAEAKVEYAFCQTKDDVEYQLIQVARQAANSGNWIIGECAARWLQQYGKGKGDAYFAEQVDVSESKVFQCRKTWERFGTIYAKYRWLKWSHFAAALNLTNAEEALEWAEDCQASVREMNAWAAAQTGTLKRHVEGFTGKERPETKETTPNVSVTQSGRVLPTEKQNTGAENKAGGKPAESVKAETATSAVKPAETKTVQEAIKQIESLTQFVIDHGTDIEREALLVRLKPIVSGLDPEKTTGRKVESVAASLAVANKIVNEWNMVDGVTMCRSVTPKRRQAVAARMKDQFWRENYSGAMERIRTLPALHGKNDQGWRADIDWFLRPDTVARVIEGKYDNWKPTTTKSESRSRNNRAAFAEVFGDEERATEADAVF